MTGEERCSLQEAEAEVEWRRMVMLFLLVAGEAGSVIGVVGVAHEWRVVDVVVQGVE